MPYYISCGKLTGVQIYFNASGTHLGKTAVYSSSNHQVIDIIDLLKDVGDTLRTSWESVG